MLFTQRRKMLVGTVRYASSGSTVLTGRNYVSSRVVSKPDVEHRVRPLDVSQFSLANTPRTFYHVSDTDSQYGSYAAWNGDLNTVPVAWEGGCGDWGISTPLYDPVTDLLSKVKSQKANLGVTLAKYRELCVLFTAFSGQVLQTAADLQRLDRRRRKQQRFGNVAKFHPLARAAYRGASALYLGYLFGLRQFVSDFQAISEALRLRFDDPMYQITAFQKQQFDQVAREGNYGLQGWWKSTSTSIVTTRVRARYRVFPNEQVLAQMGITNPPAVIYDAIPFSFVLNWMIPIGKYIAALDALEGVSDFRWYYTTKTEYINNVVYPRYSNATAHYMWEKITRTSTLTRSTVPLPRYEPSRHASNVLTGVALLGVLMKKNPSVNKAIVRI